MRANLPRVVTWHRPQGLESNSRPRDRRPPARRHNNDHKTAVARTPTVFTRQPVAAARRVFRRSTNEREYANRRSRRGAASLTWNKDGWRDDGKPPPGRRKYWLLRRGTDATRRRRCTTERRFDRMPSAATPNDRPNLASYTSRAFAYIGIYYILLSPHANRHVGDISVTVFCLSVRRNLVTDISGERWRRAMKFCRMVDLRVHQVFSPFGELWSRG